MVDEEAKMMTDFVHACMCVILLFCCFLVEELKNKKVVKVAAGGAHTACITGQHMFAAHGHMHISVSNGIGLHTCPHLSA